MAEPVQTPTLSPTLLCSLGGPDQLSRALSALRWKRNQQATVLVSSAGMTVSVAEAQAMRAHAFLSAAVFESFEYIGPVKGSTFGVQLGALLDTLALFSARGGGSTYGGGGGDAGSGHGVLTMQYPGVDDSLVLGMEDASEALCTDAEMRTHVLDPADDGAQAIALQADAVAFAVEASVLRDAVEDLEAVASVASVALLPTPPCAILSAEGNGSVNIELAGDAIRQWAVGVPLQFTYKVKLLALAQFLRAATEHAHKGHGGSTHGSHGYYGHQGGSHFGVQHEAPMAPLSSLVKIKVDATGTLAVQRVMAGGGDGRASAFVQYLLLPEETEEYGADI
eukprot:PRCOL_00006064-RA